MPTVNDANKYVSRAEGKLAGAARAFSFDFRGKLVLDIGSSTGGFTEYALSHGARKVVAVEKGTRQMKAPLRYDKRIELHEKTDIKDAFLCTETENQKNNIKDVFLCTGLEDKKCHTNNIKGVSLRTGLENQKNNIKDVFLCTGLEDKKCHTLVNGRNIHFLSSNLENVPKNTYFDVILADVSFISLKEVLEHAKKYLADSHTEFLVMLKPQFEARPEQLIKGVVKNERMRREIIKDFEKWLKNNDFVILNKRDNEVVGKNGNKERFYLIKMLKK